MTTGITNGLMGMNLVERIEMSLVKMKRPRKALFGYKATIDSYDLKTVYEYWLDINS